MNVGQLSRRFSRTLIPLALIAVLEIAHPALSAASCSQSGHA